MTTFLKLFIPVLLIGVGCTTAAPAQPVDPDDDDTPASRHEPFQPLTVPGIAGAPPGKQFRVAVYSQTESPRSMETPKLFAQIADSIPGFKGEVFVAPEFKKLDLTKYDVLVFPGGSGKAQARALGEAKLEEIRQFVKNGGGVLGICAGAYLLSDSPTSGPRGLEIMNSKVFDRRNTMRGPSCMVAMGFLPPGAKPATTQPAKMLADGSVDLAPGSYDPQTSFTMRYHQGPALVPDNRPGLQPYVPLARFLTDVAKPNAPKGMLATRDAIVASFYGNGKVMAVSPHPETHQKYRIWYANSIRWLADRQDRATPTVDRVLLGKH